MMHLGLHADSAGITAELTVLGILSYHESLLSEAITAALACAMSACGRHVFWTDRAEGSSARTGQLSVWPQLLHVGSRERTASSSRMCRHCGAVPCRHIDVVQHPKLRGPAGLQEAMPVCLRESLLQFPDPYSQYIYWDA